MASIDLKKSGVVEQKADNTIEVKSFKDIPESARKEFMMRIICIQSFIKARNKMWNALSAASPNGRVKYI